MHFKAAYVLPFAGILLTLSASAASPISPNGAFIDPLKAAAMSDIRSAREPVIALARAGNRLVGVGQRGLVLVSEDNGTSWTQSNVPVQSDLVAVHFLNSDVGWASGHDGIILKSLDGGKTWARNFDGYMSGTLTKPYQSRIAAGDTQLQSDLDELTLNTKDGPTLPFLDVAFENDQVGYAVGSYGMIMATNDGGASWQPWLDRIDNDGFFNLNALLMVDGDVFIAGEQGRVYRLDHGKQRFMVLPTGYNGSLFGIIGGHGVVMTFGMRGNAYRSADRGATWTKMETGTETSISGGTVLKDGRFVLTCQNGQVLISDVNGTMFTQMKLKTPLPFASVIEASDGKLALGGLGGVTVEEVQ